MKKSDGDTFIGACQPGEAAASNFDRTECNTKIDRRPLLRRRPTRQRARGGRSDRLPLAARRRRARHATPARPPPATPTSPPPWTAAPSARSPGSPRRPRSPSTRSAGSDRPGRPATPATPGRHRRGDHRRRRRDQLLDQQQRRRGRPDRPRLPVRGRRRHLRLRLGRQQRAGRLHPRPRRAVGDHGRGEHGRPVRGAPSCWATAPEVRRHQHHGDRERRPRAAGRGRRGPKAGGVGGRRVDLPRRTPSTRPRWRARSWSATAASTPGSRSPTR